MSNKDFSWLPTVSDTPGIAFTWQQGAEVGNNTLTINFFLKEIDSASAKSGDFELNVADDEIIVVKHKGSKIVQWRLTDELNQGDDPVEWILNRNTTPISLEVSLRKKEDNDWPCLRKQPLLKAEKVDELILSEDTLRENVGYEVPSLPLEKSKEELVKKDDEEEKKKDDGEEGEEKKDEEKKDEDVDLDALLDDAADEVTGKNKEENKTSASTSDEIDDSLEALMKMRRERESQAYVTEFEALEKAEADNTGKLDSEDEAVVKDAKENIELIKKMREIIVEKRHVRTLPVSIENIIKVLQLEIKKIITNSGNEKGEENEDFANDEEKSMTGEQLFKKGLEEVKAQTKDSLVSAFHFLRLASLKFNHSIATMVLHRMYTQFRAPTKGAFFLLRMALQNEEVDSKANRSVGELIDGGSHPFTAIWSLAVFFLQRAAQKGDAQSMMRLSNLFFDGMCHVQRGMVVHPDVKKKFMDKTRGDLYLEAALNRGLSEGYLLKASMYLRGENGHTKDTELAKKYFELVKHTDQEAASRLGPIFEPKPAPPAGGESNFGGGLRGAFNNKPAGGGAVTAPSASGNTDNSAASRQQNAMDRLQALTQRSGGGDGGAPGGMQMQMPGGAGGRGGMMMGGGGGGGGGGAPSSPWQRRFETIARFGAGAYFMYIAAFPVRLMVLPYFYEFISGVMGILGGGSQDNSRQMRGGMLI